MNKSFREKFCDIPGVRKKSDLSKYESVVVILNPAGLRGEKKAVSASLQPKFKLLTRKTR